MPSDYEKIRNDNIRRRGEEFDDIGRLISEQLYGDRSHFVYELLQNAEDALERRFRQDPLSRLPVSVQFRLYENRLEFRHFGQLFDEEDVRAISDVLKGTKGEDKAQIGKFGIGFKSVYAFTSTPEIHSGEEHFIIERYIRPRIADQIPKVKDKETLFVFPFNHEKVSPDEAYNLIAKKLKLIGSRVLLFLKQINEIKWYIEGKESGHYLREQKTHGGGKHVTVIGQTIGKEEEEEDWLVFEHPVTVENTKDAVSVEVAFRLEFDAKTQEKKIVKVTHSPLVAYFSTDIETRLGFIIQGPYCTTPSRDNIPKDNVWNKKLVNETASLIIDSLEKLKNMGLLTVSVLEALPIRKDDFPIWGMFRPIVDSVRHALMERDLLPTDDGTFAPAKSVKLSRGAELRKLLTPDRLKELLSYSKELKWLSGEITRERTPDLRSYLMNELYVEEITGDVFVKKLSTSFLENQSDEWIISFYTYLLTREALWKKAEYNWESPGVLRNKPIIRLNNGIHVDPFRKDGSPNAFFPIEEENDFQIVKIEIANNKSAYEFLKKLGIPEHDLVDEVLEKVLPKYNYENAEINLEEHKRDIKKIQRAYQTDSNEKKVRLLKKLIWTPFIYAENLALNLKAYKRPVKLYFSSQDLLMYFEGNEDIWFVSSEYDDKFKSIIKPLGVSESIRVKRIKENYQGYVVIKSFHGYHERGCNGFDLLIKIDGLEYAIKHPTKERSLFIWNNFAIPYLNCISGVVESSSRKTFEYSTKETETSSFGNFLISSAWLPDFDEKFRMPCELSLDELPESFIRNEKLADQLGMKKDAIAKLAKQAGVRVETLEKAKLLEQNPDILELVNKALAEKGEKKEKPAFANRAVSNPERREERLSKQMDDAPVKEYHQRDRSVRTTRGTIDPVVWLRNQYTNEEDQLICQICKEEMPFKKLNGEYYFECVELFDSKILPKEHEAQFLALCPLCESMYKEFIKKDKDVMENLKLALISSDNPEIPIQLGELSATMRFVDTHLYDLKFILREFGR